MNMLSAKKVRMHGMQSSRWTTRDKLTQYKGLINLYTRDRKILSFDNAVARKKQIKELKQLRKDIKSNRGDLDNAVQGDRQQLRNTLAEYRDLQLAFQNLPPTRVIDHLHQGNFNKRKLLDRMDYRMKQKTRTLINLKLELAELKDRLTYEAPGQIPVEQEAQIITGKVQDAILKKEAALAVRHTYKNILDILKKDSLYFDAILATLKLDSFHQSRCMVRTTELGQLATEYLDDRKQEFKELEKAVKRDMKSREVSLTIVREEVDMLTNNMSLLIRKDSDINLGYVSVPKTNTDMALQYDIECIEKIFKTLRDTVYVSNFDNIFPCLIEQSKQRERLHSLLELNINNHRSLSNKRDHGETMRSTLKYTMHGTTLQYQKTKLQVHEQIQEKIKIKKDIDKVNLHQNELLVRLRSSLQQLLQKCSIVISRDGKNDRAEPKVALKEGRTKKTASTSSIILPPSHLEENGLEIITLLTSKLQVLLGTGFPLYELEKADSVYKLFYHLTTEITSAIEYDKYTIEESLITEVTIEDAQVPTYNDIKAKSKELVEISTVNEDLIPMFVLKKKKKFKF